MDPCSRHIEIVETLDEHEDRIKYLEIRDTDICPIGKEFNKGRLINL